MYSTYSRYFHFFLSRRNFVFAYYYVRAFGIKSVLVLQKQHINSSTRLINSYSPPLATMTDTEAPAETPAAPAAPVAKAKKTKSPKPSPNHPKYREMVTAAITSLKERSGSSRQAIVKYITANYKVGDNQKIVNNSVKLALKAGVTANVFKQTSGAGASGSFKLGSASKPEKKVKKAKKPVKAKKAAKPKPTKKPASKPKKSPKKPASKPKKSVKKATPKKTAKPKKVAAKKKPKKPATKKATKPKKAKK